MQRLLIVLALLMTAPLVNAQVYKWTDATGTIHYSQSPPPTKGTQFKELKPNGTAPASAPAPAATVAPTPVTADMADTPANRAALCTQLKSSLAALQGSSPVVGNQGGKQTILDPAARKQASETAQEKIKQYCQPK